MESGGAAQAYRPLAPGRARIDTTQTYAWIRPAQLKRAVEFYEGKAVDLLAD